MNKYTLDDLARLVDHTNLHPDATEDDMRKLCDEARRYHFKMVAVNQVQSKFCSGQLVGTDIDTGAAIAFPLGQTSIAAKEFETKDALANGANEIDYVLNITQVKAGNWAYIEEETSAIVSICNEVGVPSKAIFECCLLTNDEKIALCKIARKIGPTFVKTSTGFSKWGATVEDVRLMKENVGPNVQVKAAGGIRDADTFLSMVHAGATRIGCSAGVPIIEELKRRFAEQSADSIEL